MGDDQPPRTLAARLEDRDRARFAGRAAELKFLYRCLDADPPASVVHVTGPGGIGKSALLRELARQARERGFDVISLDGRQVGPAPGALEAAMNGSARSGRAVVLVDSYERMAALDTHLRRDLVPALPDHTLVIIAGRGAPDPAWFTSGWETVSARIDLTPMPANEARALLAAHGLADTRVPAIIEWAAGSPLALSLAADAAREDPGWNAAREPDRPEIIRALIHRLIEAQPHGTRRLTLGIAAVARSVTPQLVRVALPHADADAAYAELCGLAVTEPLGEGIALHDLVRKAVRADLRRHDPELERHLRRRIVDYLYERAIDGQPLVIIDMAHLVDDPLIRWGFGWDGSADFRIDSVRDSDADDVSELLGEGRNQQWWRLTRRFFTEAPERVAVARDLDDQIRGYLASVTPANAPRFADADPLLGPWLAHARARLPADSVLWHAAVDFTGQGKVQAMLGMAGVLRSGVANPRFAYLPIDPLYPGAADFARALGATHLTELAASIGGQLVECHQIDYGAGGLLGALRSRVYAELGLPVPAAAEPAAAPAAPSPPSAGTDSQVVREALKNFGVPRELARSPLARGSSVPERAEHVRSLLRRAAREAFGDSHSERLLREVLAAGYLEHATSHEEAAARLCLSRAAYFRRLRTAIDRLAEHLADH
jgi:hypothetical protein